MQSWWIWDLYGSSVCSVKTWKSILCYWLLYCCDFF